MSVDIEKSWGDLLNDEFKKPYFDELTLFLKEEYKTNTIFPPGKHIFNAFNCCPFDSIKVVIIGQDPYHGPDQANGLCFSVNDGIKLPPSLLNIFKEINNDLGVDTPVNGDLSRWASQGVLLLNATLTVRAHEAGSHQRKGWEVFTDAVIKLVSEKKENIVFFLWGAYAQKKGVNIDREKHCVLESVHPSPLSAHRGFFGKRQFTECNEYLIFSGQEVINWE
jgi:uracil-DNA glycosylase